MPVRFLHIHSTFAPGGKETRSVRLMNAFGDAADHVVLSAVPGALGARQGIDAGVRAHFPANGEAPPLTGRPALGRYRRLARYMADFDCVLTYNWGAMDAVMAHRLFRRARKLPPLVHHEDGFNSDELDRQMPRRRLFRASALRGAAALVVPSQRLEEIARTAWRMPAARLRRVANGIALDRYAGLPPQDSIPGFQRVPGDVIVGTMAGLRAVKNLPLLVRAFAGAQAGGRLVILGEGPEREAIERTAVLAGVADRVLMPGHVADPALCYGHFDLFALPSDSEQFPIALVEAMAAGLPVVATDVGDVARMLPAEARRFVVPAGDEGAFGLALAKLVGNRDLRHRLGALNRARAWAEYGEQAMIGAYRTLYAEAMGRPGILG